jgi:hypothetical protein
VTAWEELQAAAEELRTTLVAHGHRPYVMPVGGSAATGALGFAAAYRKLLGQLAAEGIEPAVIVHATTSGGSQAGAARGAPVAVPLRRRARGGRCRDGGGVPSVFSGEGWVVDGRRILDPKSSRVTRREEKP